MFVIRGSKAIPWTGPPSSLVGCSSLYLHAAVRGAVDSVAESPPLPVHRCALRARRQVASLQLTFEHPADHPALYPHRRTSYHRVTPLRGGHGGGHLAIPFCWGPGQADGNQSKCHDGQVAYRSMEESVRYVHGPSRSPQNNYNDSRPCPRGYLGSPAFSRCPPPGKARLCR